jgi:hypothetical protein
MTRNSRLWFGALTLVAALQALPVQAAPDKLAGKPDPLLYLPNDSEYVVTVNLRKILDSALVKDHVALAKLVLQNNEHYKTFVPAGFDPFKDLDTFTSAGPITTDKDKGLVIVTGKFEVAKFHKHAEELAKKKEGLIKVTKLGNHKLWEITPKGEDESKGYMLLLDKNTLLVSGSKDYLNEAVAKAAGQKKAELKKEMAALLKKADKKQVVSVAVLTSPIAKVLENNENIPNVEQAKGLLDKLNGITAGVTLGDEVKIEVGVGTKDKETAKEMSKKANQALLGAPLAIGFLLGQNEQLAPFVDVVKELINATKVKSSEAVLNVKVTLTKDFLKKVDKLIKEAKKKIEEDK